MDYTWRLEPVTVSQRGGSSVVHDAHQTLLEPVVANGTATVAKPVLSLASDSRQRAMESREGMTLLTCFEAAIELVGMVDEPSGVGAMAGVANGGGGGGGGSTPFIVRVSDPELVLPLVPSPPRGRCQRLQLPLPR